MVAAKKQAKEDAKKAKVDAAEEKTRALNSKMNLAVAAVDHNVSPRSRKLAAVDAGENTPAKQKLDSKEQKKQKEQKQKEQEQELAQKKARSSKNGRAGETEAQRARRLAGGGLKGAAGVCCTQQLEKQIDAERTY